LTPFLSSYTKLAFTVGPFIPTSWFLAFQLYSVVPLESVIDCRFPLSSYASAPVLDTLKWLKHETDIWFEITNLMIPDENDDQDETKRLCEWVMENLGDSVPLHFTAFHRDFKMTDKSRTPAATLKRARQIAQSIGIKYCYVGNVYDDEGQTTYCPACQRRLIRRSWHDILEYNLNGDRWVL